QVRVLPSPLGCRWGGDPSSEAVVPLRFFGVGRVVVLLEQKEGAANATDQAVPVASKRVGRHIGGFILAQQEVVGVAMAATNRVRIQASGDVRGLAFGGGDTRRLRNRAHEL